MSLRHLPFFLGAILAASISFCQADEVAEQALFHAAFLGDVSDVDAAIARGANVDAVLTRENGIALDITAIAAVAGNCGIVDHVLELQAPTREELNKQLNYGLGFLRVDCVDAILRRLEPLTNSDPAWIVFLAARRIPPPVAEFLEASVKGAILGTPAPDEPANFFDLGRFAESTEDPALAILRRLVRAGADVNAADREGQPGAALLASASVGDLLFFKALQELGAKVPDGVSLDALKVAILVGASAAGNVFAVSDLLAEHVNPSAASPDGRFALPLALKSRRTDIARLLLEKGVDPNLFGQEQASALDTAIRASDLPMTTALLAAGAKPGSVDGGRAWGLRWAVRSGSQPIIGALLEAGASIDDRDSKGRTVLHDYLLSDDALLGDFVLFGHRSEDYRTLGDQQLQMIRDFGDLHFDFSATDEGGRTALDSAVGNYGVTGSELVAAMLAAGALPSKDTMALAISNEDAGALEEIVRFKPALIDDSIIDLAFRKISTSPNLAGMLLRAGARLPPDKRTRDDFLTRAAESGALDVVVELLGRGVPPDGADFSTSPISLALQGGHGRVAAILFEHHASVEGERDNQGTILHDLVLEDIEASEAGTPAGIIQKPQQQAIAELIGVGFDAGQRDRNGATAIDLTQGHPHTLARLESAMSMAETTQTALHGAVRKDDLETVKKLKGEGADLSELDGLGRSPLTLALQLGRGAIALFLLDVGADFTLEARNELQQADVDFASKPDLAAAFLARLLKTQLINVGPNDAANNPRAAIAKFQSNEAFRLPNADWRIACNICGSPFHVTEDLVVPGSPLEITRVDKSTESAYWARQRDIFPVHVVFPNGGSLGIPPLGIDILWGISGTLTIPPCEFDFATNPTCYPQVVVTNENVGSTLEVKTAGGTFRPLIPAAVINARQGDSVVRVDPGKSVVLDRSNGQIEVTLEPVTSLTFSLAMKVSLSGGPPISILPGLSTSERSAVYAQLAKWKSAFDGFPENAPLNEIVRKKTLWTAIHVLSAMAVERNYPSHIREQFLLRARDVAGLEKSTFDLRNAILDQSELTSGQIDLLIARIDGLLGSASGSDEAALKEIRRELVDARKAVASSGNSLRVFSENFFSEVDRVVRDYQTLALELAQYVLPADLVTLVPADTRARINEILSPRDVIVPDEALGGKGAGIRDALGLPAP